MEAGIDEWLVLMGRLHPVVVHLPIGILFLASLFEILAFRKKFYHLASILPMIWLAGSVFSVVACLSGLLLSEEGGYDQNILVTHQWLGISVAIVSVAGWVLRWQANLNRSVFASVAVVMLLLITITGHQGGSLTHGDDYLSEPIAAIFGQSGEEELPPLERRPITNLQEAVVFEDIVYPIIYDKCVRCHNTGKRKGKLNLESYQELLSGGKSGRTVEAGSPMTSELYKRIILPLEDKKHMPPRNKPQLSKAEEDLIHWWIATAKASPTVRLGEVRGREEIQSVLTAWFTEAQQADEEKNPYAGLPEVELPELSATNLEPLEATGFVVSRILSDKPFLSVNCVNVPHVSDADLKMLLSLKDYILWLNASNTELTDSGMEILSSMTNLTRLNISNTRISDAGLSKLRSNKSLSHLNLVGTKISDEAVFAIRDITSLKAVYLWNTRVSQKGIEQLGVLLPETEINAGESGLR